MPSKLQKNTFETIEKPQEQATVWFWTNNNDRPNMGIGGNGTMMEFDLLVECTANLGHDIKVIGAPKTVNNDLPGVQLHRGTEARRVLWQWQYVIMIMT